MTHDVPRIFISYRREDSADATGRIGDKLRDHFGEESVFTDVDSIPLGVDFRTHIDNEVGQCDVLLAVIGRDWLSARNADGTPRLDDPADFVRIEIESALRRDIPVIPLLVRGASIPQPHQLPDSIEKLAFHNAQPIRPDPDFRNDADRLIRSLVRHFKPDTTDSARATSLPKSRRPQLWAPSYSQDSYGHWCGFEIEGIEQRLRWIPPGKFLMGSPEDEPERLDREQLHSVTLTQGYLLAETACSQALWNAVMGKNPSLFKGADLPVENVSWDEVKQFIARLNARLPGLDSRLPSEAEWEYAARAGSQTPFWWGSTLSPEQANYDGNYPYADGKKGHYREETVPVKTFEPNPFGLYQVHGNVWEWCEDWFGEYEARPVKDPQGPESGERRVCRGGSWGYAGRRLRAAYRDHGEPDNRYSILGFRLSADQLDAEHRDR